MICGEEIVQIVIFGATRCIDYAFCAIRSVNHDTKAQPLTALLFHYGVACKKGCILLSILRFDMPIMRGT